MKFMNSPIMQNIYEGMKIRIVISLVIIFGSIVSVFGQRPDDHSMRFMSYNVLHGFENDSSKMSEYVGWVKKINPDVIAYQELNNFTQDKLSALAKRYGHNYAVISDKDVTHPLGLTSKYPIVMVKKVIDDMWHSYLYGVVNNVHIFVTHLSPFEKDFRLHDIEIILAHARLLPESDQIIIAGDFNSLAAIDSMHYGKEVLKHLRLLEGRKEPKSGLPIVKYKTIFRKNLNDGQIDYSVTNRMLEEGFTDAYYSRNHEFKQSAPSKKYESPNSYPHRIDYIWVNKSGASTLSYSDIIQNDETDVLSDHYPVIIDMENSKTKK